MELNNITKEWTLEDDKHIDASGLIGFQKFEENYHKRLAMADAKRELEAQEKLKKLDEEMPREELQLRITQMKAKERFNKELQELEDYEDKNGFNLPILSLSELLAKDFPPIQWLVRGLIPRKGLIAISGAPASYKSWITQHLALSVSTGTPLFNKFETKETKILIIDRENQLDMVQRRFKVMGALEGLGIYFFNSDDFYIEDEQTINKLCNWVSQQGIGLVIFDSLIRIYRNKDENSSNAMAEVFRQLRKFQDAGATVVFVHHHRKSSIFSKNLASEAMRGSSDILASVDAHISVEVMEDYIKVSQPKLRYDLPIKPFKIKLESSDNHAEFVYIGDVDDEKEKFEEAKEDILQVLEEGETPRSALIDRFKGVYGSKTLDLALKSFEPENVVVRVGERGKKYYRKAGTHDGELFDSADLPEWEEPPADL